MKTRGRRKLKKQLYIILTVTIIILLIVIIKNNNNVTFNLIGEETLTINANNKYNEQGVIGYKNKKELDKESYYIDIISNLDISKLGTYEINYKIKYKNKNYDLKRTVIVWDKEPPIIDTNIDIIQKDYCTNKESVKFEYEIKDNYDQDLTQNTIVTEEDEKLIIQVKDTNGNISEKTIPINYINKPTSEESIKLKGTKNYYIAVNGKYKEYGATITSGCKDNANRTIIDGNVDTTKTGEYIVNYYIQNNKQTSISRKVVVYEPNISTNQNQNKEKTIYLTFDDGPCAYTKTVLNTLKTYNVKATFFVTNQFPSYVHLIKDEYEQGHAIGVHTYKHDYSIYSSIEDYVQDFNKMNDVIEKYTGKKSNIFRFPGGASNTISANYSIGIMRALATKMSEYNYAYFDWDVSSGDASGASKEKIINNIIRGVSSCSRCVVLMHDINGRTVSALNDVLAELTSRGYKFGTLSIDSPTCHHGIAN